MKMSKLRHRNNFLRLFILPFGEKNTRMCLLFFAKNKKRLFTAYAALLRHSGSFHDVKRIDGDIFVRPPPALDLVAEDQTMRLNMFPTHSRCSFFVKKGGRSVGHDDGWSGVLAENRRVLIEYCDRDRIR